VTTEPQVFGASPLVIVK
jgi:hypothetical protein